MEIDLSKLKFEFQDKPLLIGGEALEHYGIRKAGNDIDFVVSARDHSRLVAAHPGNLQDIYGDLGVLVDEFEIWNTICTFDYDYLKDSAVEQKDYLVISIEKLLFLKVLGMKGSEKNTNDVALIAEYVLKKAYGK